MQYLVGKLIDNHVKELGMPYYKYAIDKGMLPTEFTLIRTGARTAAAKKIKTVFDIELLREPILDEVKTLLDEADTELIINVYNQIYNAKKRDLDEISKD